MRHTKKTTLQITRVTGSDETGKGKDRHSYLNLAHVNPEIADGIGRVDSCLLAQEGGGGEMKNHGP